MLLLYYLNTHTYKFNTAHSFPPGPESTANDSQRVENTGSRVDSVRRRLGGVSQLVVLEAPPRDLVAQVLHVLLHLKETGQTLRPPKIQTIICTSVHSRQLDGALRVSSTSLS